MDTDFLGVKIDSVEQNTPAYRAGLRAGDWLRTVDSQPIRDALDLMYSMPSDGSLIEWVDNATHTLQSCRLEMYAGEDFGVQLSDLTIKQCINKCLFCFVRQLPKGLRRELYIKDEDFRLSFLYGNYITGSNLSDDDISRIIEQRLAPLYISVHATDHEVRSTILGIPSEKSEILPLLHRFMKAGISFHTQIVLCPDINDGLVLEKTIADLLTFAPALLSIAVVPVGLTSCRKQLPQLKPVDETYAKQHLASFKKLSQKAAKSFGSEILYFSDEFYILAEKRPPLYSSSKEFPQLENGVGMYARFYRGLSSGLRKFKDDKNCSKMTKRISLITGKLGTFVLSEFVEKMKLEFPNIHLIVLDVKNSLFGSCVTVSGLIPGNDILHAINDSPDSDCYIVPSNALRPEDLRFIDDLLFSDLLDATGKNILIGGDTALDLLDTIHSFLDKAAGNE